MISNQPVTMQAQATLTPAMIENLLKDPTSWLSRQQQAALEERLRVRKEVIRQGYLLAHGKEMDDRIAEVEAQKLLDKEAEQARVQGLDKYYKEQHQLALKLGTNGTPPTYFDVLLTRQADLARTEMLLGQRNLELTDQIEATQAELKDTQAELDVVTREWTEAKLEVEKTREQIDHKFNNDTITVDKGLPTEREVSVSTNVLPEKESKRVIEHRVEALDQLVNDGSVDTVKYGIMLMQAFKPVLQAQGITNATRYASHYVDELKPYVGNLINLIKEFERLNRKRAVLSEQEARQLEELANQMKSQRDVLQKMLNVQQEILQLKLKIVLAAANPSYSDANLIGTQFGFLAESRQRERQQAAIDKQQGISLEKPAITATERTTRGMRAGG